MNANLDTDLLRTFAAVADERGFTRAADRLGRTQSAVSMQIKRLEDILQARLFEREGRNISLSPEGQILMGFARRMLRLNDEAVGHFLQPEMTGPVRIGVPDDYASYMLPPVLAAFAQTHPGVRVDVTCDNSTDLFPMLQKGGLDLALLSRSPHVPGGELIRREKLFWVTSATHDTHEEDPLPLAMFPDGCICRRHAIRALEKQGRAWRAAYSSRSTTAIHGAVVSGFAVSAVEETTIPDGVRILNESDGFDLLPDIDVVLHLAPGDLSAAAARLADHIRERLGQPAIRGRRAA